MPVALAVLFIIKIIFFSRFVLLIQSNTFKAISNFLASQHLSTHTLSKTSTSYSCTTYNHDKGKGKVKVKLSLCLTEHHAMKM
jgi:hypothetical protein